MKKTELEQRIKQAFDKEKPDISARLVSECDGVAQDAPTPREVKPTPTRRAIIAPPVRRTIAAVICLVFFIGGIFVGRIPLADGTGDPTHTLTPASTDATVYIDVNPSVEIEIDGENRVIKCTAGNDDATLILEGLELDGVRLSTAVSAIVGSMYINGYLNDSANSILVSVDTVADDGERTDTLLGSLTDDINAVFKNSALDCSIIAQSVEVSDELREQASANGVSVGKLHLVDKMIGSINDLGGYDRGELSGLSINELNKIYSSHRDEVGGGDKHSGIVSGFIDEDDVIQAVHSHLGITEDDVNKYDVGFGYFDVDGERRLIYRVHITIIGNLKYRLIVDCESGEVLEGGLVTDPHSNAYGSDDIGNDGHGDPTDPFPPPTDGGTDHQGEDVGDTGGNISGDLGADGGHGDDGMNGGMGDWFDGGWFD